MLLCFNKQDRVLQWALPQQMEKGLIEIRPMTVFQVGFSLAVVKKLPIFWCNFSAYFPGKCNTCLF